ncbi:hypothetical protein ASPWEDRAFT_100309 [Aspergillus wentii DTO 134E9]|uniref:Uncharacterized protein n=1 Tax=Aspergillus wentii DTO 134E9 TaxID=1073089 RepID=A0A1L9S2V7_ASPWE|nr:uncharacterized protein ASPWEDRAFT_100309 [Aspergillus wentii DTO 134E9]KAI9929850.1 hypothetical protein MW887_011656 [Aspergillus wentii]OJJ41501.1 hypothetical protein ASPWEDRAFT_100309 [Aspergillus wentii DTO 134E9]
MLSTLDQRLAGATREDIQSILNTGVNGSTSNTTPEQVTNDDSNRKSVPFPVAIVGMGMRLPGGVNCGEQFWDFLVSKKDGLCKVPESRYNVDAFYNEHNPGAVRTQNGYFLEQDIGCVDAPFFSMSKVEAAKLDPQQRLLLEVIWECMENGGQANWQGNDIGCYVGVFGEDWLDLMSKDLERHDRYHAMATGDFAIANRISYEFDLHGPSMTLRTGCSSSLVGLHEACQALYSGECSSALVAGTNLIITPTMTTAMSENMVLSPSGICRTFDAAADGYGRGEAVNAIFIKPLDAALRDGDPVRAVIRSTAVNCDGKTPSITTPGSKAQESLIRRAYQKACIDNVLETGFFECHGTGTIVGDTSETSVVANIFREKGIYMGAVKPNVGHSEGASGITSVIKAVLALEKRTIPPNVHFTKPNPNIPFNEAQLTVPVEATPWPSDRRERISVNSFGIGGTNAHLILDSAASFCPPTPQQNELPEGKPHLLVLSAKSAASLESNIEGLKGYLENKPALNDLSYTLATRREHLPHRAFTTVDADGSLSPFVTSRTSPSSIAFVFTGQGAQWPGMGRELILKVPEFKQDIESMDRVLQGLENPPSWTIEEELLKEESQSRVREPELAQPLCTAIQIALVNLLRTWGIVPESVVGHSSGEIAAAYASGAIPADFAMINSYFRGQATAALPAGLSGAMAAVGLGSEDVKRFLKEGVTVACVNSPQSVTISGDEQAVQEIVDQIKADDEDIFCRRLAVNVAYHSHHMAEPAQSYQTLLDPYMKHNQSMIPFYSTATGQTIRDPSHLSSSYWRQNLESPVLFDGGAQRIIDDNYLPTLFLEIGPHSTLSGPLRQIFSGKNQEGNSEPLYVPTLIRKEDQYQSLLATAGRLHGFGALPKLSAVIPDGKVLTDLPPYAWQHEERYWDEPRVAHDWRVRQASHHELLGARSPQSSDIEPSWRNLLQVEHVPWLMHHRINNDIVFPCAGYLAMAGEAIRQITGSSDYSVRNLFMRMALVIGESDNVEIVTSLRPAKLADNIDSAWYDFTISAQQGSSWRKHVIGQVRAGPDKKYDLHPAQQYSRTVDARKWYTALGKRGLEYGPEFQGLQEISASPTENRAAATMQDRQELQASSTYAIHPVCIDQSLQLLSVAATQGIARRMTQLCIPIAIDAVYIKSSQGPMSLDVLCQMISGNMSGNATLTSDSEVVLSIEKGFFFRVSDDLINGAGAPLLSTLDWKPNIDFVAPEDQLLPIPSGQYDGRRTALQTGLIIIETFHLIKSISPVSEHLQKYKDWIGAQYDKIVNESPELTPEMRSAKEYLDSPDRMVIARGLFDKSPDTHPLVFHANIVAERVLDSIQDILEGRSQPLEILMADENLSGIYEQIALLSDWDSFLSLLSHSNPSLRVLEIGAGTGGATSLALKPLLDCKAGRRFSKYTFTDISPGFIPEAKEKFKNYPGLEYSVLDISKDPTEQGFEPNSYDLVIAANVFHATPSLSQTLSHVRKLLVPNGRLLLQELCPGVPFIDFIMGILPGWWLGEADGRKDKPYVSPERWNDELINAGFTGTDIVRYDNDVPYNSNATMLSTAAAPRDPSKGNVAFLYHTGIKEWTRSLEKAFLDDGYTVEWFTLQQPPPSRSNIICLMDLAGPFLDDISGEDFKAFKGWLSTTDDSRMLWLTRPIQMHCDDPRFGLALGFFRTVRDETSHLYSTLEIDCFDMAAVASTKRVFEHIERQKQSPWLAPDSEFCLSDGMVHTGRYQWAPLDGSQLRGKDNSCSSKALDIKTYGIIDSLHWVDTTLPTLSEDEVEVDISYVGLNFRDMMIAHGLIGDCTELGFEGSGVVRKVGSAVSHLQVGDGVMVMGLGICSTRKVLPARVCRKIPEGISLEDAATVGCVYATVIHSLINLGNLQKEDTVLIHSACGGVGLAAIQICKVVGAEIFATVGNEEKRKYLIESMGIPEDHIFDSRSTSFLQGILNKTDSRGVDMVLNSLSGELLHASWKCVAPFGKMLELGKRDFLGHGKLDMDIFQENRAFFGIDLHHMFYHDPKSMRRIYAQFDESFKGKVMPIRPINVFDAADVKGAFRLMQSGKHMGKIVIKMPEDPALLSISSARMTTQFRPDASYLLVGGLGGLGRAITTWMVEKGARNFVFLSRSGGESPNAKSLVKDLTQQGCQVTVVVGSVAKFEDVQRAISASSQPLAGVLQLSMVLKDISFSKMAHEDWTEALAPKVQGSWNLHHALGEAKLDFFVLFSSVNGIMGNAGQANYAAANTFLDAFTKYRNGKGLAASVIDVGVMEDIGFVSESSPQTLERARRINLHTVTESELFLTLEVAIFAPRVNGPTQMSIGLGTTKPVTDLDAHGMWSKDARTGFWKNVLTLGENHTDSEGSRLREFMSSIERNPELLNDPETEKRITREIGLKIASQMSSPDDMTDEELAMIKIDSLMTIEIRSWFRRHVGIEVSLGDIANSETVGGLGKLTIKTLREKHTSGKGFDADLTAPPTEEDELKLFLEDMELGKSIHPIPTPALDWRSASEGRVFLTGATGFVGSYLLVMLGKLPSVKEIACLVRAEDVTSGMSRLKQSVGQHGVVMDFESKVTVLPGDLSDATFGLGQERFDQLAEWASVVFHFGSMVNYILPYSDHRRPNVLGLTHILNFANTKRLKPVHYCSSINVWGPSGLLAGMKIPENEQPPLDMAYIKQHVGHTQSKFVAETVAWNAISNGFPVSIYRAGVVTGHSATGIGNPKDLFARMMSNCIRMGFYADPPAQRVQSVPIDFVCSAILRVSESNDNLRQAFNVVQPDQDRTIMARECFQTISRLCDSPLRCIPAAEWLTKFSETQGHNEALVAPLLRERLDIGQLWWGDQGETIARYDTDNLKRALSAWPEIVNFKPFSECLETYYARWTSEQ